MVPANNKKEARLNCIAHLLAQIDYESQSKYPYFALPSRGPDNGYRVQALSEFEYVDQVSGRLMGNKTSCLLGVCECPCVA